MRGKHIAKQGDAGTAAVDAESRRRVRSSNAVGRPDDSSGFNAPVRGAAQVSARARSFDVGKSCEDALRKRKIVGGVVVGILALLIAVYVGGALFFTSHFYPESKMGEFDISLKSSDEVANMLTGFVENDYTLNIEGDGFDITVTPQQAKLTIDGKGIASSALSSGSCWSWPLEIFESHDYSSFLEAGCDSSDLGAYIEGEIADFNAGAEAPSDAHVAYDEETDSFEVVKETFGTQLSAEAVMHSVADTLCSMGDSVRLTGKHLLHPSVTSDDPSLASMAEKANAMLSCDIDLMMSGRKVASVGPDQIAQWVIFADGDVSFDNEAVVACIDEITDACNTARKERSYTRPDGKQVKVNPGTYGWIVDADALASLVEDSLENGASGPVDIPFLQTGNGNSAIGDWGRFCDVDLTEQHARFYDESGSCVWESDIVSGAINGEDDTPTGVYMLNSKAKDVNLVGPVDPETNKPEWDSPVSYWMPFVGNMVGLHDAPWQSSFGGTRYKDGYGSHGCINLPLDKAEQIYSLIQIGDPVIVHW